MGNEEKTKVQNSWFERVWNRIHLGMKKKLIVTFLIVMIVPLLLLTVAAWNQISSLGVSLREIAVSDSFDALDEMAVKNIERMSTDTANRVADFLYARDADIIYLSKLEPSIAGYSNFIETKTGRVVAPSSWRLFLDGAYWIKASSDQAEELPPSTWPGGVSQNEENNYMDGFNYFGAGHFDYIDVPLYDEITYIDLEGNEIVKVVAKDSTKKNYPLSALLKNVSDRKNTYVKAETYFAELLKLKPGEIYVSDVIGAYVPTNFIGMYTPEKVENAAADRGYDIRYSPEDQAYAGMENPRGKRFEGIIRWGAPVTNASGQIVGYVTLALNHDHIMEFVDHITPMDARYTELPSAFEGNYAFIWDYKCRNIAHPRHHSIVGFDPETGEPQVPWLESSIYEAWQASGIPDWTVFIKDIPTFDNQSRDKVPAAELTKAGLVGLDGRYLNNAPQCTGWMDLTAEGGSGSFYIKWSGIWKLNTAAAIPYYTGQYAPSLENGYSKRGFGFVAIGSGLDDFTRPATVTEEKLGVTIGDSMMKTTLQIIVFTALLILFMVLIAIGIANFLTNSITKLIEGIERFRSGARRFRFTADVKDEFGLLADSFDEMADSIVTSVKNPMVITDINCNIIYANDEAVDMIGEDKMEDVEGESYTERSIYPNGSEYDPIRALNENRESEIFHEKASNKYFKGIANYLLNSEGKISGYIIESIEVSDMVQKQIALEHAVDDANRANAHKSEFLSRMSHEIRTPMNAIIGLTKIVQKKLTDMHDVKLGEVEDHMEQIETSSQHLLGLLNEVLDISKIEAGKITIVEEAMDLAKLVKVVGEIVKPRCDEKNIALTINFNTSGHTSFISDSMHLRQVLINLLGNAVKFTPELGRIDLNVEKKEQDDGKVLIKFAVCDSGVGIAKEAQEVIFKAFEQESSNTARRYGGTGLGLAISQRIINLLGGEITVDSEIGRGSEFSFSIWMKETEDANEPKAEAESADLSGAFDGKRALLVDDVDINRMIVLTLLEDAGLTIDEAVDGQDAVEQFCKSPECHYDIIFMDVQMPVMDGYEATEKIRASGRQDASSIPIIALTANAFQDDIDKAIKSGMNAHIMKPVEIERLLEVMRQFI